MCSNPGSATDKPCNLRCLIFLFRASVFYLKNGNNTASHRSETGRTRQPSVCRALTQEQISQALVPICVPGWPGLPLTPHCPQDKGCLHSPMIKVQPSAAQTSQTTDPADGRTLRVSPQSHHSSCSCHLEPHLWIKPPELAAHRRPRGPSSTSLQLTKPSSLETVLKPTIISSLVDIHSFSTTCAHPSPTGSHLPRWKKKNTLREG
jgi:hypothetical protein